MATRRRTVEIEVVTDDKKARADLNRLAGASEKTGKSVSTMGTMVKAGLAAFGAREMIQAIRSLDELRTQMGANEERADTVFGSMADDAREWADENNEAFGIGENALLGLASNMQDLLVPMGFARAEAKGLTEDTLIVANALDDWKGGTLGVENATERITKAMLGEREGLVELGIKISEADVKQRLLEKGQDDLTGAALEQAKATATLELITDKSADAMAKYADRAGTAVAVNKELRASTEDAKETAADFFGPILDEGKAALGDVATIGGAAGDVIGNITGDDGGFDTLVKTGLRFVPILGDVLNLLGGTADAIDGSGEAAAEAAPRFSTLGGEMGQIPVVQEEMAETAEDAAFAAQVLESAEERAAVATANHRKALIEKREALQNIHDPLSRMVSQTRDLEEAEDAVAEAEREYGEGSPEYRDAVLERAGVLGDLEQTLKDLKDDGIDPTGAAARVMLEGLGIPDHVIDGIFAQFDELERDFEGRRFNMTITTPDIHARPDGTWSQDGRTNHFHQGGVVPGTPGEDVPIMAQAGEEVTRRAEVGGQSVDLRELIRQLQPSQNITVTASPGMNEFSLASAIAWRIKTPGV